MATMPGCRHYSTAAAVSRNGASVVHVAPVVIGTGLLYLTQRKLINEFACFVYLGVERLC